MRVFLIYKGIRRILSLIKNSVDFIRCKVIFWGNNVQHSSFNTGGIPYVSVAIGGIFSIGKNLCMNNGIRGNPIGCFNRCTFFVDKGANLKIGSNLGISQAAIICHLSIEIGDNVKIGGGARIYDTDFHSIDPELRLNPKTDFANKRKLPVVIEDNVFIGAYSTILKGVTIGRNSIIGSSSVVTKNVPSNEIWAGNPARFIKYINV
jgi:acetyltransferase-like isoleucine patch superfamily enzyme